MRQLNEHNRRVVVAFGSLLHGKGALWLDRVEFDAVDSHVPCTSVPVSDACWHPRTSDINETHGTAEDKSPRLTIRPSCAIVFPVRSGRLRVRGKNSSPACLVDETKLLPDFANRRRKIEQLGFDYGLIYRQRH